MDFDHRESINILTNKHETNSENRFSCLQKHDCPVGTLFFATRTGRKPQQYVNNSEMFAEVSRAEIERPPFRSSQVMKKTKYKMLTKSDAFTELCKKNDILAWGHDYFRLALWNARINEK